MNKKSLYCIEKDYDLSRKRLFFKKLYRNSERVILGENGRWKINREKASFAEVQQIFWDFTVFRNPG